MIALVMVQTIASGFCVPSAAGDIAVEKNRRKVRGLGSIKTGCTPDAAGVIQCSPESMRAVTERKLQDLGLYGPSERLDMTTYAMARNIHSEAGDRATAAEKLAIGETLVTRALEKGVSMMALMTRGGKFAKQKGCNPCVSSARDPAWEDIFAARVILSGRSGGISRGATHYFAPRAQDSLFASGRVTKNRLMVYDKWTAGGDLLTWVGYVPGIDFERQMFFRKMPRTAAGRRCHAKMKPIGRRALQSSMPSGVKDAPVCRDFMIAGSPIGMAGTIMAALALPAFLVLRYGKSV